MRLSELSARSGLSKAAIKYYMRVGLLAPGTRESSTWASYEAHHLRRLRLIRALTEVAGLALSEVRAVVDAIDESESAHQARGAAQWPLSSTPTTDPTAASTRRVDQMLARHGWELATDSPHRRTLAAALDTLDGLGFGVSDEILDVYATALEPVAEVEVAGVVGEAEPMAAAERLVVGTLLYEPVILTLRRMAHESASSRR